ncbi:MAG: CBS domain-containing protein [Nakamurella sp.]
MESLAVGRSAASPLCVRALMTSAPPIVDQFDAVIDAARRMRATGSKMVAVTDDRSRFLGIVSDRDIVERSVADGQNPNAVTAGSLVRPGQPSIDPSRIADRALLALIVAQPLAELPVIDDGRLVGMLTVADVAVPLIEQCDDEMLDQYWPDDSVR